MSTFPWYLDKQHQEAVGRDSRLVHGAMNGMVKMIYKSLLGESRYGMMYVGGKSFISAIQAANYSLDCLIKWDRDHRWIDA